MSDNHGGFMLKLRNWAGVPIIEAVGDLNETTLSALETAMRKLAAAGHYHIILNLKKAASVNFKALSCLGETVSQIRKRYGGVDLVAEAAQIREMMRLQDLAGLFRFSASEGQAVRKIKKLLLLPEEKPAAGTPARLTE